MRILIVEDEEKLAQSLKRGMELEGYAADYVLDGEAAENRIMLYHDTYDLIVLDLMLPKKNGFDVCKSIRERKISTPILVLTARDSVDDKTLALNNGADDYLVKPFSLKELVARIKAILRRPPQTLPVELKVGDLALNTTTRKASRAGKDIDLTLKEFSLLEYFMRHPNQALRREQIADNVWDFNSDLLSNAVDVHVKNLRHKIDAHHSKKLLETVRGVGYRLTA